MRLTELSKKIKITYLKLILDHFSYVHENLAMQNSSI